MGFTLVMEKCDVCGYLFYCNPIHVASLRDADDVWQVVCIDCITVVDKARAAFGLDPMDIHLEAYDPCDESELG